MPLQLDAEAGHQALDGNLPFEPLDFLAGDARKSFRDFSSEQSL
jgi:hypothetical protein